jgi:hypothetical protein
MRTRPYSPTRRAQGWGSLEPGQVPRPATRVSLAQPRPHRARKQRQSCRRAGGRARLAPGRRPDNIRQGRGAQRATERPGLLPKARPEGRGRRVTWRPLGPPHGRRGELWLSDTRATGRGLSGSTRTVPTYFSCAHPRRHAPPRPRK